MTTFLCSINIIILFVKKRKHSTGGKLAIGRNVLQKAMTIFNTDKM